MANSTSQCQNIYPGKTAQKNLYKLLPSKEVVCEIANLYILSPKRVFGCYLLTGPPWQTVHRSRYPGKTAQKH